MTLNANRMPLRYCIASYLEPKKLSDLRWYLDLTTKFSYLQTATDFAFATLDSKQCVICYRGTEGIKGWISDLQVFDRFHDSIDPGIEDGFGAFAHDYYAWTVQRVAEAHQAGVPVYLTGHSRGGACASVTTLLLARDNLSVSDTVTFGSPMWCNEKIAEEWTSRGLTQYRYYTTYDVVVTLPPLSLNFVAIPAGVEVRTKFWLPYPPLGNSLKFLRGCHDHKTETYQQFIGKD